MIIGRGMFLSLSLSLSSENHRRNRLRVWPLHLRQKWSHQTIKIRSIYCHLEVQQSAWIRVAMLKSLLFMWIIQHEIHKDLGALLWSSFVRPGDHNFADGVLGWTPNWQHIAAEDVNYDSSAIQQQYTYIIHTLYIHYTYCTYIYMYVMKNIQCGLPPSNSFNMMNMWSLRAHLPTSIVAPTSSVAPAVLSWAIHDRIS